MQTWNVQRTEDSTLTNTNTGIPTEVESDHPGVFADIYQDSHNIAIWRRHLSSKLQLDVKNLLASSKPLQISRSVSQQNCLAEMREALQNYENTNALIDDITRLVDLFCSLFDLKQARLRLTALDRVMCSRFHVDNLPCRLVTTYLGCSTQWLPEQTVDRTKLGKGNDGLPDELSGIYRSAEDIQQLNSGDVALLKGARWKESEHFALVHRSPTPKPGETRLLLTLDFVS